MLLNASVDFLPESMRYDVLLLQVMEQLLRLIPDIRHIFVIVRSRPGLSGEVPNTRSYAQYLMYTMQVLQ